MKRFSLLIACLAMSWIPIPSSAQSFPTMPIKVVVPYPPGGAGDLHARMIGEKLAE